MNIWRSLYLVQHAVSRREPSTCPRRMTDMGPWPRIPESDAWTWTRWSRLDRFRDWLHRNVTQRGRFFGGTYWPKGEPKPRTCSFCGSCHPDDALALLRRGWDVEPTDKLYKRYLHPPMHRAHRRAVAEAMRRSGSDPVRTQIISSRSPVPPVKIYVGHFTEDQIREWNRILAMRDAQEETEDGRSAAGSGK